MTAMDFICEHFRHCAPAHGHEVRTSAGDHSSERSADKGEHRPENEGQRIVSYFSIHVVGEINLLLLPSHGLLQPCHVGRAWAAIARLRFGTTNSEL